MDERKRDRPDAGSGDDATYPVPGDMADAAQQQMPGKPPNLTVDPGKRYDDLARQSGDRALAEAEQARRKNSPGQK